MSNDISVDHCVVEFLPRKRDKDNSESVFNESSPFHFLKSECRIRASYGWESNEQKIRVYVKSQPVLPPNFYVSVFLFKGNKSISFPKKLIPDPIKWIWSSSHADISKQLPGVEKWNFNIRFTFQKESDSSYDQRMCGNELDVQQTSLNSLEKLSDDLTRLLSADTMHDIKIRIGDKVVKAHKAVLRGRSPFFKRLLKSSNSDHLELLEIDPAALDAIVMYLYSGKFPDLSSETAKKIYKAGELCDADLKQRCVEFLIQNLTIQNACEYLVLAEDDYFKEKVISYIMDKDIPFLDEYWKPFCDRSPKSANVVLNKLVRGLRQVRK